MKKGFAEFAVETQMRLFAFEISYLPCKMYILVCCGSNIKKNTDWTNFLQYPSFTSHADIQLYNGRF